MGSLKIAHLNILNIYTRGKRQDKIVSGIQAMVDNFGDDNEISTRCKALG